MDFNPDHEKWQCCCCHVDSGLKILALVELVLSLCLAVLFGLRSQGDDFVLNLSLFVLCLFYAIGSLLLLLGLHYRKPALMYPSVVCRVVLVTVVAVFGVSMVLRPGDDEPKRTKPTRGKTRPYDDEPSMTSRLLFLIFVMMSVCCAAFYTIFLIMNAKKYVRNFNKLRDRRQSTIQASQILDPELFDHAYRRSSHQSNYSFS